MKKTTRALLLSLCLLPGAGHFVLQRPGRGCALVAAALAASAIIVRDAMTHAFAIVDRIERGEIPLDQAAIEQAVRQVDTMSTTLALYALIFIWLVAAIDVYRIGRRLDAAGSPSNPVAE